MSGPVKMKVIRVACPMSIVQPFVQEYLSTGKWKFDGVDLASNVYSAKRAGLFGDGMLLEAKVEPGGPDAPNECAIAVASSYPKTKIFAGGVLQKVIDEFEEAMTARARAAIESGQAAASQWRPSI